MAVIEIVQRVLLGLLAVPVVVVLLDLVLELGGAVPTNPIVSFIADAADLATPRALATIFPDQGPALTVLLVCVMYGLIALVVVGVSRLVRMAIALRRQRSSEL